ncbi:MAG: hypothetical protein HZB85_01890 [Deltaproteobacteria bacterium]|nr:hypothetical protein [Deltaproteobacteria bacterium]
MDNFERSIAFILRHEGGYVNDPRDPGGETNFGISKRAYPYLDIKGLTVEDAKIIYKKDYWDKAGCGALEWPLCLVHFDACVNLGIARATEIKAKAFNWTDYLFLRIEHYNNLRKPEYLRGWINRTLDLWKEVKKEG